MPPLIPNGDPDYLAIFGSQGTAGRRRSILWIIATIAVLVGLIPSRPCTAQADEYRITSTAYPETADFAEIVEDRFGEKAQVADWATLKAEYSGTEISTWVDRVGIDHEDGVWLTRDGARWHAGGDRHYFLKRHDGDKRAGFLAHDEIGGHTVSLGSWYDMKQPILVRVPTGSATSTGTAAPDYERTHACSLVSVPGDWTATEAGEQGRAHELRGQTYRVRQYLAPNLLSDVEITSGGSALVPIPTRVPDPSRMTEDTPIGSRAEALSVLTHYMNTNSNLLSVRVPNEWAKKASDWKEQRHNIYDPQTGKVATGLLLGGKLLGSIGLSMAAADLTGLSSVSASATDFVISLGSTSLSFYQSVTATPRDKSLAPAMAALSDLDPKYKRKILEVKGSREYLNRYFEASSEIAGMATSLRSSKAEGVVNALAFAASEWEGVSSIVDQIPGESFLLNTPAGQVALTNAHEFMGGSLTSGGLSVTQQLLFRDVQSLTSGFNKLIYTANLYATVLEAYAHQLDTELQRLKEPSSFQSWSAYSEALAQYQYRVGRYHEVKLGLVTNMYEYAEKLNSISLLGYGVLPSTSSMSVPDESVQTYRTLMKRQRTTYNSVIEEVTRQMHVVDLIEARYPDLAQTGCSAATRGFSKGPSVADITIDVQGQKLIGRTDEEVKWRFATQRRSPSIVRRTNGVAYVVDGKDYRTEESHVYAINVATGDALWSKNIGNYTRAGLIDIRDNQVLIRHTSGIYAVEKNTGTQRWVFDDFSLEISSYTITDGVLLFLDGSPPYGGAGSRSTATLHAVSVDSGEELWARELTERQARPVGNASYEVNGDVVVAKNTNTGRTYRINLKTGKVLADSGPPVCPPGETEKIVESAFGPFTPGEITPDLTADLNGDGVEERFYQQLGTNSQGQIKVIAVSGAAPCRQIFSTIVFSSDWEQKVTVLDRTRNGYRIFDFDGRKYAFDGEWYSRME